MSIRPETGRSPDLSYQHLKYRPDIDGLRAVAVILVMFFHCFPDLNQSGFVGVDVFFVISGYLITKLIAQNFQGSIHDLLVFYRRRAFRIFPALILVLFVVGLMGWFLLLDPELKELGKNLTAGSFFFSNFQALKEYGYFDRNAGFKPLLHLWSLSIEEQFYLLWPILFLIAKKLNLKLFRWTVALFLLSFALEIQDSFHSIQTPAFYLPWNRAFELLMGAIAAQWPLHVQAKKALYSGLSALGLGLLISGYFIIDQGSRFPGVIVLLPTLGTFFLLIESEEAWINKKILGNSVLVGIGLWSYSLYLWHWPLVSFLQIIYGTRPPLQWRGAVFLISFGLAFLTYKFWEKPIRRRFESKHWLTGLVLLMGSLGALGFIFTQDPISQISRVPLLKTIHQGDIGHEEFNRFVSESFFPCNLKSPIRCLQSKQNRSMDIVFVGDSQAEYYYAGLSNEMNDKNVGLYLEFELPTLKNEKFKVAFERILADAQVHKIVLSALWSSRSRKNFERFKSQFALTIKAIAETNKEIFILDNVPEFETDPSACKYNRWQQITWDCQESRKVSDVARIDYFEFFSQLTSQYKNLHFYQVMNYFCDEKKCSMLQNERMVYRDSSHLNLEGAEYVGRRLLQDHPEFTKLP